MYTSFSENVLHHFSPDEVIGLLDILLHMELTLREEYWIRFCYVVGNSDIPL